MHVGLSRTSDGQHHSLVLVEVSPVSTSDVELRRLCVLHNAGLHDLILERDF